MPLASKRGAPRPKYTEAPKRRRCIGPIDAERARVLHESGVLSDDDYESLCEMFEELKKKSKRPTQGYSQDPQPLDFSK